MGHRPASTSDDLPLPDGPTTTSSRRPADPAEHLVEQPLPAEEVVPVGLVEGVEPHERGSGPRAARVLPTRRRGEVSRVGGLLEPAIEDRTE